jgi:hypothetical protein
VLQGREHPLKSESILMENVKGFNYTTFGTNLSKAAWFHFMIDIAKMEERMANDESSAVGSFYFERDLLSGTRRTSLQLLKEDGIPVHDNGYWQLHRP